MPNPVSANSVPNSVLGSGTAAAARASSFAFFPPLITWFNWVSDFLYDDRRQNSKNGVDA